MGQANAVPLMAPVARPIRTAALWVPDWPVLTAMLVAEMSPHLPAVVMSSNRVVAASASARATGIRRGMRKRTAQSHCPQVVLLPADEARDAVLFETVATAAEQVVAGLEVMRPGVALLPADGAARYHGGEEELVASLIEAVSGAGYECQVGLADGILAAVLAAREDRIVPTGTSLKYLRPRPVTDLLNVAVSPKATAELNELLSLWLRLGLKTLGDLVALPSEAMAGRFGAMGVWAQRLANGQDLRPPAQQRIEDEVAVTEKFDPPLYQVETAVVVGQELAAKFVDLMVQRSLACGRVRISATTPNGLLSRVWRTDDGAIGGMSATNISQRLRWQLEGWLTASALARPRPPNDDSPVVGVDDYSDHAGEEGHPAPILSLEVAAEEVAPASTYQMSLWGGNSGQDQRAIRALSNVQGLLGLDQVEAVAVQGERTPWDRAVTFSFGEPPPVLSSQSLPWPSALTAPAPSIVVAEPIPVRLLDERGNDVIVNLRQSRLENRPGWLLRDGKREEVTNWAGPWLIPGDWWEGESVAVVLLQVVLENGSAYLLQRAQVGWEVRGEYE